MEWHSFPLITLYRLVQGQLVLLINRTSSSDDNNVARTVDDILLRQAHWAEDIELEMEHLSAWRPAMNKLRPSFDSF